MMSPRDLSDARSLMSQFADRTGLSRPTPSPQRYLWTDAFAVGNYLALADLTGETAFGELSLRLIDQVHETLGRHRRDDTRQGWISGLDEAAGRRHPTAGGLRIGKRLNERPAGQALNEREEWDRDGQYFHYLTKWMLALDRVAIATSNPGYCRYGIELAKKAHAAFRFTAPGGVAKRLHWKMSIDLSRPLVPSMGQHDPLDALVSYGALEHCRSVHFSGADLPDLGSEIVEAAAMCAGRDWVTDDPLGIGGLLVDACRIATLQARGAKLGAVSPAALFADARIGLSRFASAYSLQASAEYRLAFRELGLAIGLYAVAALHQNGAVAGQRSGDAAASEIAHLARALPLAEGITTFWQSARNQSVASWREHLDINCVMLATSLLPPAGYD